MKFIILLATLFVNCTFSTCNAQAQIEVGSSLAIFGNHEPMCPVLSWGYFLEDFNHPIGATFTKAFGENRISIVAIHLYNKALYKKAFFIPGAGYMLNKTPYLNSRFEFYWTLGYKINKTHYIAYKHISNGTKIFNFMASPNDGENIIVIGTIIQ